jgi:phosphoglycerate dehydrogenase-like enzyme
MRAALYGQFGNGPALVAERLSRVPGLELDRCETTEALAQAAATSDVLIMQQMSYEGDVERAAAASKRLRWIQLMSAGYDHLVGRSFPEDVVVTNAGPSFGPAVADHALALLLALTRNIPRAVEAQARAHWQPRSGAGSLSLEGRSALVLGLGAIGRCIATRLNGFGMVVSGVNRDGGAVEGFAQVYSMAQLDDALAQADVVVLALPLSSATKGLFDRRRLQACKPGSHIVNIGRGGLVDLDALTEALKSGHLAGAGLDVTEPEPLPDGHPAWSTPNLLITPHVAGTGSHHALAEFVARNAEAFQAGRPLEGVVQRSALAG